MKFSIVIPTFNGATYVDDAIQSALRQTRPADEIIVSDDNSQDDTLSICQAYGDRIKIHTNPDGPSGFVNGWNNAVDLATGDYVSVLHQDDTLEPTFLEEAEKGFTKYPKAKYLFAPCNYINEKGSIISSPGYCNGRIVHYSGKQYIKAYYTFGTPNIHRCPGVIIHSDVLSKCRFRPEAGHIADDDFFYRVGQYTDIIGVMSPLANYRIHASSVTGSMNDILLSKKLLEDYDFQLNHFGENILFDHADRQFFKYWKYRHLRRVLGYSIKHINLKLFLFALKHI